MTPATPSPALPLEGKGDQPHKPVERSEWWQFSQWEKETQHTSHCTGRCGGILPLKGELEGVFKQGNPDNCREEGVKKRSH